MKTTEKYLPVVLYIMWEMGQNNKGQFSLWIKALGTTIKIKASEWYFAVVLLMMLYKMSLNFQSLDENLKNDHSSKPVVLSKVLLWFCSMGLNYQPLNKSLSYDHSNKSFCVVLCCDNKQYHCTSLWMKFQCLTIKMNATEQQLIFCGSASYAVQGCSNFILWMEAVSVTIQMKATEQYFLVVPFEMLHNVVLSFESVKWNPKDDDDDDNGTFICVFERTNLPTYRQFTVGCLRLNY